MKMTIQKYLKNPTSASYDAIKEQMCFAIQDEMAESDSTLNAAIAALAAIGINRPETKA